MTAEQPTILATSGGYRTPDNGDREFGPLLHYAADLAGAGVRPKVCHIGTAGGDQRYMNAMLAEAGHKAGFEFCTLNLFTQPTVDDIPALLLDQDVIWVGGGSVVNLLAVWRAHGLPDILRQAWEAGVVLSGVSAGSICWYIGGPTDSFGLPLRNVTNGLGFLPYGSGVHYDGEADRRPAVHQWVASGELPETHCSDDGVGLVYYGTQLVDAVAERPGAHGYVVRREGDRAVEEQLTTRVLS